VQLHVSACVRVGPASIYIPVKIEDLQLDAVARVTMRPLVDTLPCIGAIQISLTDAPFADLTLKLINSWDILSLPFIHDAVLLGVKVGTEPVRTALHLCNRCSYGRVVIVDNG
jgi:Ca2+-dependent lipid-binding protein